MTVRTCALCGTHSAPLRPTLIDGLLICVAADLSAARLQEIRARCEAATPGPWWWNDTRAYEQMTGVVVQSSKYGLRGEILYVVWAGREQEVCSRQSDADFIAAARTDVPALLAHIAALEQNERELRGENDLLREAAGLDHSFRVARMTEWQRANHDAEPHCAVCALLTRTAPPTEAAAP